MAITVNGDNATMVGFKFDDGQNNATTKYEDTVVIVNDGRLMFNQERLGLTELERSILDKAIQDKLLSKVSISLSASLNPYELTNTKGENDAAKATTTLTLLVKVNGVATNLVQSNGAPLTAVNVSAARKSGGNVSITLNNFDKNYIGAVIMNAPTDSNNYISSYLLGSAVVTTGLYVQVTDEFGAKHIIPLAKPSTHISTGGLIYYGGTTNTKVGTPNNNFSYALGVSRFTNYVSSSNKGALALNIGTMTVDDKFQPSKQDNIGLTCDSLSSSASGRTLTLSPDAEGNFYGIVVLPQTINLGKFANGVADTSVFGDKVYNATNIANNADSPFILLHSTDFSAPRTDNKNGGNFVISSKHVIYNVYRTKNLLVSPITIKL